MEHTVGLVKEEGVAVVGAGEVIDHALNDRLENQAPLPVQAEAAESIGELAC